MPKVPRKKVCKIFVISQEKLIFGADKHQSFLQVDTIILDGFGQACPKYPDKSVISLRYFKKEVRNEVDYLYAGKH